MNSCWSFSLDLLPSAVELSRWSASLCQGLSSMPKYEIGDVYLNEERCSYAWAMWLNICETQFQVRDKCTLSMSMHAFLASGTKTEMLSRGDSSRVEDMPEWTEPQYMEPNTYLQQWSISQKILGSFKECFECACRCDESYEGWKPQESKCNDITCHSRGSAARCGPYVCMCTVDGYRNHIVRLAVDEKKRENGTLQHSLLEL